MTADPRGSGRRRPWRAALAAALVLVAGVSAWAVLGLPGRHSGHPAAAAVTVSTAPVVRSDLASTTQVGGSLGYLGSYTLVNQAQGTAYTRLPAVGTSVRRGQRLYEVDGTPVILFYGPRPEWRTLGPWVAPGPDVAQLDRNLIALGYASAADLTVSDYYTTATGYAVARWQAATGLPVTGTVPLGQVSYASGPLRITGVAVPINALVALAGGGYAVEVVRGSARYLVAVQTGLFSNTLVQVSGAGLAAGLNVEVPSA